jgi:DNA polymerase-3 subunit alpha (Gram-positive type)
MVEILSASNILAIADINNLTTSEHYYHRQFSSYMQIYAKNQEGLKALYKLITTAHIKQSYGEPTLFRDQIEQVRENLIITSSPFWGDL